MKEGISVTESSDAVPMSFSNRERQHYLGVKNWGSVFRQTFIWGWARLPWGQGWAGLIHPSPLSHIAWLILAAWLICINEFESCAVSLTNHVALGKSFNYLKSQFNFSFLICTMEQLICTLSLLTALSCGICCIMIGLLMIAACSNTFGPQT